MASTIATRTCAFVALAAACATVSTARAQPTLTDKGIAQTLFDEGRVAMGANRVDEACAKFGESYRVDPTPGTLLNLALCHEKQGRTASAYTELNESLSRAIRDQRAEREKIAREHLATVTPRLSRLTVNVAANGDALAVTLDGAPLGRAAWGIGVPVDPGEHTIDATAPGKRSWHGKVNVGAEHDALRAEVPALEDEAPAAPTAHPSLPAAPLPAPEPPARDAHETSTEDVARERGTRDAAPAGWSTARKVGWASLGVGAAGVVVGSVFGGLAMARWSGASTKCPGGTCASAADRATYDGAGTFADVSTVAFAFGAVGVAAGALLLLTAPSASEPARALTFTPTVGSGGAGLGVRGVLW